jgi:hypothetical protein
LQGFSRFLVVELKGPENRAARHRFPELHERRTQRAGPRRFPAGGSTPAINPYPGGGLTDIVLGAMSSSSETEGPFSFFP